MGLVSSNAFLSLIFSKIFFDFFSLKLKSLLKANASESSLFSVKVFTSVFKVWTFYAKSISSSPVNNGTLPILDR